MAPKLTVIDGLRDFVTGLGGGRDRTTTQSFAPFIPILPTQIEAMYRTDWLAGKIVDIIPQDMVRVGRQWQATAQQITDIEKQEQQSAVSLWPKIREALVRARLLGGACIFIGIKDANPSTPLDVDSLGAGSLAYLNVLARTKVSWQELDQDPQSPFYGQPKQWIVSGNNGQVVYIHPSRMIKFQGIPILTRDVMGEDSVWGDSILQRVYEAIRNAASVQQHIAGLVPDARNDVIYIPGLGEILNDDSQAKKLTKRFQLAWDLKSMFRVLLLEGNGVTGAGSRGETWQQRQISFSQLPDLMRSFIQVTAGAADIPVTRLLGESPAGENSTGEADLRNYYDHVRALQTLQLEPQLNILDRVVKKSAGVNDDKIFYTWRSLWSMSPKEQADVFETKSKAARALVGTAGTLPIIDPRPLSNAMVNSLTEDGSLPGLEAEVAKYGPLDKIMGPDDIVPEKPDPNAAPPANENKPGQTKAAVNDAAPRSLYVRRQLLNVSEFVRWASDQGIKGIMSSDQLHVTVLYSKTPVDWLSMRADWAGDAKGRLTVPPGGPRVVEQLGESATVLSFWSDALKWRHMQMVEYGASSDYEDYVAHVTISHEPQDIDLTKVKAFQGELRFGPEIFEEVDDNWKAKVLEVSK